MKQETNEILKGEGSSDKSKKGKKVEDEGTYSPTEVIKVIAQRLRKNPGEVLTELSGIEDQIDKYLEQMEILKKEDIKVVGRIVKEIKTD